MKILKDNSWEQYGRNNPYFAVLTDSKFKLENLNDNTMNAFFESGEDYTTQILQNIQSLYHPKDLSCIKSVLDFGCGVGRVLIPLAKRFEKVVGVDISNTMLKEAGKLLEANGLTGKTTLLQSDDITKTYFSNRFSFVHSIIVLQHIPTAYGYKVVERLIDLTDCYGLIHLTFGNNKNWWQNMVHRIKGHSLGRMLANTLMLRSPTTPFMQMNSYDLTKVFTTFMRYGVLDVTIHFTNDGGYQGALIYFKK